MRPPGLSVVLLLVITGNIFVLISTIPVKDSENENAEMTNDFQLTELCEDLKNDEKKKENCGKCFLQISDVEDKASVKKCIPNLSSKVAECVKKTLDSRGDMKLEKCRQGVSKESESMMSAVEEGSVEKDESESLEESKESEMQDEKKMESDDKTADAGEKLDDSEVKSQMIQEFWLNYGTSLALKSLLKLIEEKDEKQFLEIYSVIKPCKKFKTATNASDESSAAEAVENNSEQSMRSDEVKSDSSKSNETSTESTKNQNKKNNEKQKSGDSKRRKRQDGEVETKPEHNDEICDLTHLIPELTRCILTTIVEHKEILSGIKPHLVNATTPIPAEIVKVLLETSPPCEQT